MSLITHQLKKDTRRLWPFLVVWWLLLAVQTVTAVSARDENPSLIDLLTGLPFTLLAVHYLLAILLTALVILEEPLVGTRAFWLTLPLPRKDLMLSKFLFLLLYVTLPAERFELEIWQRSLRTLFGEPPLYDQSLFLLRHRSSGEIRRLPTRSSRAPLRTLVLFWPTILSSIEMSDPALAKIPTDWLREADLVVVRRVAVGRFVHPFKIEDFRMADSTREGWNERKREGVHRR